MRWITRDKSYYRSLVTLAIPVALQGLVTFLVSFADNLMVNTLGDAAVSGVYMGSQVHTFIQMFTAGIGGSILIIAAQYWGKGDKDRIRCLVAIGLRIAAIMGAIFSAVSMIFARQIIGIFTSDAAVIEQGTIYLKWVCMSYVFFCVGQALISAMRAVEITRIGMWASFGSLVVNIGLNYLLIFGKLGFPALGIQGAAIATLCARIAETVVVAVYVFCIDRKLNFRMKDLTLGDRALAKDFVKYGLPLMGGEIVWSINMMTNSMILGGYGAAVITAASVANTLNTMAFIVMNGLVSAVGIITGMTVGAGKRELMKEYARTTQVLFLMVGLFSGALLYVLGKPFISLYTGISAEASAEALKFARVLAVSIIGTAYQYPCLAGLVKAGGDIHFVFRNDTIFVFLVVLPSAIIAAWLGAPAWVTFACLKCDQVLKCIVAVPKINSFNWMKDLTRTDA